MNQTDREKLESHLHELIEDYGPWAVLHVVTETLRMPFKELAKKESNAQPRAKKGRDKAIEPSAVDESPGFTIVPMVCVKCGRQVFAKPGDPLPRCAEECSGDGPS